MPKNGDQEKKKLAVKAEAQDVKASIRMVAIHWEGDASAARGVLDELLSALHGGEKP